MTGKSDYLENEILDHIFSAATWTAPDPVYIALFTAAPSDAGGGTEVSGGAYARASVTNNATNFPAASGGAKSNGTAITFTQASGANWGTITHFAVFDASSAGNMLYWGTVTPNKAVNDGDTASFAVGDLDFTED